MKADKIQNFNNRGQVGGFGKLSESYAGYAARMMKPENLEARLDGEKQFYTTVSPYYTTK